MTQVVDRPAMQHGFVQGRFVTAVADTLNDEDRYPDLQGVRGHVRFEPVVPIHMTEGAHKATVIKQPVVANVNSEGYVVDSTSAGDSALVPGIWLAVGRYDVRTVFNDSVTSPSFSIEVTAEHTKESPLHLTDAAPIVLPPASVEVTRVIDRILAQQAAAEAMTAASVAAQDAAAAVRGEVAEDATRAELSANDAAVTKAALEQIFLGGTEAISDAAVSTYVGTQGTATRAQLSGTYVSKTRAPVDIMDFGVDGDGSTNDSAAINGAIAELAQQGGGELIIPKGARCYIPDGIDLNVPGVSLLSAGGWLGGGPVRVGQESGRPDFSETRLNILHDSADPFGSAKGIILKQARGVTIGGFVKNAGRGISADTQDGAEGFHALGEIVIDGFRASRVDYAIHAHPEEWDVLSDWGISNLRVNFARKRAISLSGVDGLRLSDSVFFGLNYSQEGTDLYDAKEELVYVGKTNQVTVTGSKFFESGLSALRFDEISNLSIGDNIFTWVGQRRQSDAIEIRGGSPRGAITGNTFDGWTRSAIGIHGGNAARLEIGPNGYNMDLAAPFNKTGVSLTASNVRRHYVDPSVTNYSPSSRFASPGLPVFDSTKGSTTPTARDRKGDRSGVSGAKRRSIPVTGPNVTVCSLQDLNESSTFGGMIHVHARSADTSGALTADYLLFISRDENRTTQIATIQSLGYIAGGAANQPSFTWSASGQSLRASPINQTSGNFTFELTMLGALGGY